MKFNSFVLLFLFLLSGCDLSNSPENRPTDLHEPGIIGIWKRQYEGLPIANQIINVSDSSIKYWNYNELPCREDPNDPYTCFDSLVISFNRVDVIGDTIIASKGIKIIDTDTTELNVLDTLVYMLKDDTLQFINEFVNISENAVFIRIQELRGRR